METTENREAGTVPDYPRGITFEQAWAAIQADREAIKADREAMKADREAWLAEREAERKVREEERKAREEAREAERKVREAERKAAEKITERQRRELREQMKETDRIVGELGNRFGELAEHLVAPGIIRRFSELGYTFEWVLDGNYRIYDEQGKVRTEIDMLMENDDCIIAVEVKTRPVIKDVNHHIRRLEILREHLSKHHDIRKIQGAIAGAVFGKDQKKATLEAGLFVIEQSGDTMKIEIPEGFVPRNW